MIPRRLLRAVTRPFKRLARPLRLRWIDFQRVRSGREVERLTEMNEDIARLVRTEHFHQVQLEVRRQQIERGLA
jgi:hypothetical protein